jgi:hypothetical protein
VFEPASTDHGHPVDAGRVAAARARLIGAEDAQRVASLLSLLADPVRARILYALDTVEELCVGDLALALQASEDTVGYALRILRTAGLSSRAGTVAWCSTGWPTTFRLRCTSNACAAGGAVAPRPRVSRNRHPQTAAGQKMDRRAGDAHS